MSVVQMSLYQALEQKKILESRVTKGIESYCLVCARLANEDVNRAGKPLDQIENDTIRPAYQKSVALIKNLIAIKAAINDANAKTEIEIDGRKYTIANAMVLLRNQDVLINLYRRMVINYTAVENEVTALNEKLLSPEAISEYLSKTLGEKRNSDDVEQYTQQYKNRNTYSVFDPLGTREMAEREIAHLEQFKKDLHYKLTEANIKTQIEVEFED